MPSSQTAGFLETVKKGAPHSFETLGNTNPSTQHHIQEVLGPTIAFFLRSYYCSPQTTCILWNLQVHRHSDNSLTIVPILIQINQV